MKNLTTPVPIYEPGILKILYEDQHLLCLVKPRGIPSQSDKSGDIDLMTIAMDYLKGKTGKENIYLGLVHRLDRPVGGVMVFAKTCFSNRELSKQLQARQTEKEYLAVVCGRPEKDRALLEDYIRKLNSINMSKISTADDKKAKAARLEYEVIGRTETEEYGPLALLKIKLYTGRHHQVRVQMANAGLPVWGDKKYNKAFVGMKDFTLPALWSYKFGFRHPGTGEYMELKALPEGYPFDLFSEKLIQQNG